MLLAAILIVGLPLCFLAAMIVCDRLETDEEDSKTLMGALD